LQAALALNQSDGKRRWCFSEEVGMAHGLCTPFPQLVPQHVLRLAPATSRTEDECFDDVFVLARELGICSPTWLRTSCVYSSQPGSAYSILVMPVPPDSTKRHNTYHAANIAIAPSVALYTAYRSGVLTWHEFALRYLAELDAKRSGVLAQFVERLCSIPARYSGVLLLGFRQAPGGNEAQVRCTRRLLRAWLLGEVERLPEVQRPLPLPLPRPHPHPSAGPHPQLLQLHAC
jgi:uncharacterized protein YeaO (DUF488 family)